MPQNPTTHAKLAFDVAIIGAGPAGACAAIELGGKGLRIALLEKAVPPRYKTCGGGVVRRAFQRLPVDVTAAIDRQCHAAELVHHDPELRFLCRREQPIVSMVMRDQFDFLLTQAAEERGVTLLAGTTVSDVRSAADHIQLSTTRGELTSRFVIAADGANSIVARKTGRPEIRDVFPAYECEVTLEPAAMARWQQTARFDFGVVPAGYGWVFPKRNHLSIGVGTTRRGAANLPECYRAYLARLGIGTPLHEERHGYLIPCRPRAGIWDVPRVLFAGDAAGLADPVTAEGISAGIISGQLAARALLEACPAGRPARERSDKPSFDVDDQSVTQAYRASLEREWLRELRVAHWAARLLYQWPRLRIALFRRHGPRLAELMTDIVTGEATYRAAVARPRNYLKLLRLASVARLP